MPRRWGLGTLRSCWLAVRGRVDGTGPGITPLPYTDGIGALMGTMTGLSVLELVVVHLIVPWPVARVALVVAGVVGLVALLGFWAGLRTHPHLVTPDALRLRFSHYLSIDVPWSQVAGVRRAALHEPTSITVRDARLHLPLTGSTNLVLTLTEQRDVPLLLRRRGRATEIAWQADDPALAARLVTAAARPSTPERRQE